MRPHPAQADLFAPAEEAEAPRDLRPLRAQLLAWLEEVRAAPALPWDLTRALVRELRVRDMARQLPEGPELEAAFLAEMDRLYVIHAEGQGLPRRT